jgi:spore maturation protein CgeB
MRILYIAQNSIGSTSNMRGAYIREIMLPTYFKIIDLDTPLQATSTLFRSIGWRFKFGPLISKINKFILDHISDEQSFDLIWIDKGVFINYSTIKKLRAITTKLIHFTPDPAFAYHRSRMFFKSIPLYDTCITTKLYELEDYRIAGSKNTLYCTQGFDVQLHKPYNNFSEKIFDIVFIGHYEKERATLISDLLNAGFKIVLAGIHWSQFAKQHDTQNLVYLGDGIFGEEYAKIISLSYFGLGLLSNWVPELHTTRTFEIPACNTCLITPKTSEIAKFYEDREVLYFDTVDKLILDISSLKNNLKELEYKTCLGRYKVIEGNYDYKSILKNIIASV